MFRISCLLFLMTFPFAVVAAPPFIPPGLDHGPSTCNYENSIDVPYLQKCVRDLDGDGIPDSVGALNCLNGGFSVQSRFYDVNVFTMECINPTAFPTQVLVSFLIQMIAGFAKILALLMGIMIGVRLF